MVWKSKSKIFNFANSFIKLDKICMVEKEEQNLIFHLQGIQGKFKVVYENPDDLESDYQKIKKLIQ
jgi:hypothetical protein